MQSDPVRIISRVLKEIAEEADVEVFAPNQSPRRDPWINAFHPLSNLPYLSPRYDHVLAVLGNDAAFRRILALHHQYPGPCITFDDRLTEFHRKVFGDDSALEVAGRYLQPQVDGNELDEWLKDPHRMPMTFLEPIARNAHPLFVHSRQLERRLAGRGIHSVVHLPPCGMRRFSDDAVSVRSRNDAKERLGFRPDRVHLLVPGGDIHEWGHWEIPYVLEQLRRWGIDAESHWVGSIGSALPFEMEKVAGRIGNGDRLHLHEVSSGSAIPADYYLAADFGVVFRTHGMLGVPMDVLDCVDARIPTVMNRELSQALALDSVVMEVREPIGAFLIAESIQSAYRAGLHRQRQTSRWDRFSEGRSLKIYAGKVLEELRIAARGLSAVA